jgi:hypothetical protein
MMRRWVTSIVLTGVILVAVAVAVAGCGSQKRTIPTKDAQSFLNQLDKIGEQFDNGSCTGAGAKVATLSVQIRQLPSSVDPEVKSNLQAGAARLGRLVSSQCQRPTPTNTTPTNTVPTVPTAPTNTTPTNTVPTTPSVPTTPNTTPTSPGGGTTVPTTPGGTTGPGGGGGGVTVPGTGAGGAELNSGGGGNTQGGGG